MKQITRRLAALEEAQGMDPALLRQELADLSDEQLDAILRGEAIGSPAVMRFLQPLTELCDAELNAIIKGEMPNFKLRL